MTRVVLAAHGTRDARGVATIERLHRSVRHRLPEIEVELGWLSVTVPELATVLATAPTDVVVPLLLGSGYHVQSDIPDLVGEQAPGAIITRHLGPDRRVIHALADRLAEVDPDPVAVVLAAAGTSHPVGRSETRQAADMLSGALGVPVGVAYASGQGPDVSAAVHTLRASGADRVSVVPHLLAPGMFADRVQAAAGQAGARCAAVLGDHPALVHLVADRVAAARQQVARLVDRSPGSAVDCSTCGRGAA